MELKKKPRLGLKGIWQFIIFLFFLLFVFHEFVSIAEVLKYLREIVEAIELSWSEKNIENLIEFVKMNAGKSWIMFIFALIRSDVQGS